MVEVLQPDVLVLILAPTLFFAYLILTNSSSLQRVIPPYMLAKLYDKMGISKAVKNTLLLLSAVFLIVAYSRVVVAKKMSQDVELHRDAAIIIVEDRASDDALKKALELYKEARYSVAIYLLTDSLYMLYPQSMEYDFLENSLIALTLYEYDRGVVDIKKIEPLKQQYDSLYVLGIDELPSLEPVSRSDMFVSIEELYIYPLSVGVLLLFIAIFIPFRFRWKLALLLLLILPKAELNAGVFDFYYLQKAYKSYSSGEYKEALEGFSKIDKNRAYYNIGNCYYKLGEYQKALENYQKFEAKSKEERFYKAYNEANCYLQLKERKRAQELYKKALEIRDDPKAKINLELVEQEGEVQKKEREKIPLLKVN